MFSGEMSFLIPGSSPLTRGTQKKPRPSERTRRFIPAYAGNSPRCRRTRKTCSGSSPLTRGTPICENLLRYHVRFIPAYAGNSASATLLRRVDAVHPRLRGELFQIVDGHNVVAGSSPLTRGTLDQFRRPCHYLRFIPAYAGNSVCSGIEAASVAVHPRLRGELAILIGAFLSIYGSSPLTRGTRFRANSDRK